MSFRPHTTHRPVLGSDLKLDRELPQHPRYIYHQQQQAIVVLPTKSERATRSRSPSSSSSLSETKTESMDRLSVPMLAPTPSATSTSTYYSNSVNSVGTDGETSATPSYRTNSSYIEPLSPSFRGLEERSSASDPLSAAAVTPVMRLSPSQERQLWNESRLMAHSMAKDQIRAFAAYAKREPVASKHGVRVFSHTAPKSAQASGVLAARGHETKRFVAHWQVHATMDEVVELLARDERECPGLYRECQAVLSPENVHCKSLWQANGEQTGADGGDRGCHWLGINWWVQRMPGMLRRDRDFVLVERQDEFMTPRGNRGFVHLRHSVDIADVTQVVKGIASPFIRGSIIQSGIVALESDVPGIVLLSHTMEVDLGGMLKASQHQSVVVQRLVQGAKLEELLAQARILRTQPWLRAPDETTIDPSSCARCHHRSSIFTRRTLAGCVACHRVVCGSCCQEMAFLPAMMRHFTPKSLHRPGVLTPATPNSARICSHCVTEFSRPRSRTTTIVGESTLTHKRREMSDVRQTAENMADSYLSASHKRLDSSVTAASGAVLYPTSAA
ncbi:hypothetical protein PINS_up011038 [Pythium insidiosum]|nr:hypothetical protein PINS_up011038 [Pythium insidiosum]